MMLVTDFTALLQGGNAWLFMPSAILLGALHGLEPGHSKTMMAAFIVAVRGTVLQAVLLGLAATVSHTAIVWIIALAGLHLGAQWNTERIEPYFQLLSAALIIAVAVWMIWRKWREDMGPVDRHSHDHHSHSHHGHQHDGRTSHDHSHDRRLATGGLDLESDAYEDAHARAHADDIRKRFSNRNVTTGEIVMFGLTGGLIPCPAAITVLLLCLQIKKFALGATLVLCFSIGLALTLVAVGAAAAVGAGQVSQRWPGFDALARRAPYLSAALIIAAGLYTGYLGWTSLSAHATP